MFSTRQFAEKMSHVFFAAVFVASGVADGVTNKDNPNLVVAEAGEALSVGIVSRADADIQIRRIKIMMATSRSDADNEIEQLEKLQKILHGQN